MMYRAGAIAIPVQHVQLGKCQPQINILVFNNFKLAAVLYAVVAIDILGPLPESNAGDTHILVEETILLGKWRLCHMCNEEAVMHCGTEACE